MSKTSQRKKSLERDGYNDAIAGKYFKWKRHPNLVDYKRGYRNGQLAAN